MVVCESQTGRMLTPRFSFVVHIRVLISVQLWVSRRTLVFMNTMNDVGRLNKGTKVRIKAFDVLKLYAIFLVLWGHCIQHFLSSNHYDEPVYRIIYSFHMPLFMMISGYFSLSSMSMPPIAFLKKKFVQLILPTISWGIVIVIITDLINTNFLPQSSSPWLIRINEAIGSIISGFYGPYPFWFLKTCFICYLLAYCGSHLRLNKYLWMCITLIISQFIPHFVSVGVMYPCFIIGMEFKDNQKLYSQICRHFLWLGGLFLLMLCFWDQFFWGYDGILKRIIILYLHTNNHLLFVLVTKIYKLAIGVIGSLAFIGLFCSKIPQEKTNKLLSICGNWGQYTLGIYILQSIILEVVMAKYIVLDGLNFYLFNFIISPILSLAVLVLCIYIIKKMSKSSRLAFFFFGTSSKPTTNLLDNNM